MPHVPNPLVVIVYPLENGLDSGPWRRQDAPESSGTGGAAVTFRLLAALVLLIAVATGCTTTLTFQIELDRPITLGLDGQDGDA